MRLGNVTKIGTGCFAIAASLLTSNDAFASTGNAMATSAVRPATTLAKTRDLDFGSIIRGATAGTVTLNARTGVRTRTGGVALLGTGFTTAAFSGSGTAGTQARLSVGAPTVALTRVGGGATMTLNTLRVSIGGGAVQTLPRNFNLPASGLQTIAIGGRLNVAANQLGGVYAGTFTLTMNYQ
jgi:Mat/Ecp fimbriae major subunit